MFMWHANIDQSRPPFKADHASRRPKVFEFGAARKEKSQEQNRGYLSVKPDDPHGGDSHHRSDTQDRDRHVPVTRQSEVGPIAYAASESAKQCCSILSAGFAQDSPQIT